MLKNWWYELNQREQYSVGLGGVIVTIFIVYLFIWNPLTAHIAQMRDDISQNTQLLTWMDSAAARIEQFRAQGYIRKAGPQQALLVAVEQSLMQQKLSQYISSTQQQSNNQLTVSLKNAPFDQAISWLETIWEQNNITVDTLLVTQTDSVGVVNMTVGLKE